MRNDDWLMDKLAYVWMKYFPEVSRRNKVAIRFKGKWKNKFGHIKRLKNNDTEIAINGLFRDLRIPEYVIELTLAHELVHYMHGFHSPHPKMYRHPHAGGIVTKELKKRGFVEAIKREKSFLKEKWENLYKDIKNGSSN